MIKNALKIVARTILGDYSPYFIYHWTKSNDSIPDCDNGPLAVRLLDDSTLMSRCDPAIHESFSYAGSGSLCYGCFLDNRLVGACFYWFGDRYRTRNFWPLKEREAKLVQIIVTPEMRGRGVARLLIRRSADKMSHQGFTDLYARIWHSNHPSIKAFEGAGWRRIAFVAEINPLRTERPIRIRIKL